MRNPLNKRIVRELKSDVTKYIVIFLFMIITIGLVSGYMVACNSMSAAYQESFVKYNVEDGHFELKNKASEELLTKIKKEKVEIYEDFYVERNYTGEDGATKTLRIFSGRESFNKVCVMKGELPKKTDEIAIDRMYADNNNLTVGDHIEVEGARYTIAAEVAFSDYSTMFENNSDMMFDSINFSVVWVSPECFEQLSKERLKYNYAWFYTDEKPGDVLAEKKRADDLSEAIQKADGGSEVAMLLGITTTGNEIKQFVPRYANMAINFAGDDIGDDRSMMMAFLVILVAVMAFIFGVTISHTITKEAGVIGTLRASGYTKGELFRQYMAMPLIVTLIAAAVGNIIGYGPFKTLIARLYYNSYSLTTYETRWDPEAFLYTTVIPVCLMMLITSITLIRKLKFTPLQFLRRDLTKNKKRKVIRLSTKIPFLTRFRMRIILQNVSGYLTLCFGVFIAMTLLLFGLLLRPLLDDVAGIATESMVSKYQYMMKEDSDTSNPSAEKFAAYTMKTYVSGYGQEDATVYGIFPDSKYVKEKMPDSGVLISTGMRDKYLLEEGDTFLMKEPYENKLYEFVVSGTYDAPTTIGIYMSHEDFCELYGLDEDYYSGYFSDEELTDINENKILTTITDKDMTKMADQLKHSMGDLFLVLQGFAVLLFIMVVYLLTKIILEKNSTSISMIKILGYYDAEIGKLYLVATSWVVVLSVFISFVAVTRLLSMVFVVFMKNYSGWLPFSIRPTTYITAFLLSVVSYLIVALLQMRKIKKVPMDEALKNVE